MAPVDRNETYPSLINASLAEMPRDIAKLVLCVGSVCGDRHRLRYEMGKRSLAVLDRNRVGLRPDLFVVALL